MQREDVVETMVTCPFLGPAVAAGLLPVLDGATDPLAAIGEVKRLGNTGGGDLGDLLAVFALGNHAYKRGPTGRLDQEVPLGLFSLELPGSQGSHPGHSGILQGDPGRPGSGRLDHARFSALAGRAEDGVITRRDVGRFIAENLANDPQSRVFGVRVAGLVARDLADLVTSVGVALVKRVNGSEHQAALAHRRVIRSLTRLLGENNLLGSAGEFGLLFAFLANGPGATRSSGTAALALDDLRMMFVEKRLPDGWETWKKTRFDWLVNTSALALSGGRAYAEMQVRRRSRRQV